MATTNFTEEETKDIITRFNSNQKIKDIADFYNKYPQVIQNLLRRTIGYIPTQVKTKNVRYFKTINTNTKAYFAGFIAADGAIVKNELTISIHVKDIKILQKLKEELESPNQIIRLNKKNTDMVRFTVGNKMLKSDLENLGITSRKTFTLQNIIENIPKEHKSSFILGYFDGDGSFSFKRKTGIFSIRGTKELLSGFANVLEIPESHIKKYDSTFNLLEWSQKKIRNIFLKLYLNQDFYLERKYKKFVEYINNIYGQEETISSPK